MSPLLPPAGAAWVGGSPILLYHRVTARGASADDPFAVSEDSFAKQIASLADRFALVTVRELVRRLGEGSADGFAAITFDDGYRCTLTRAVPILVERGATATVFLDTERLDSGGSALRSEDVLALAEAGVEIGSHSVTHRNLVQLADTELRDELVESRGVLERIVGRKVTGFAHPYGRYDERVLRAVQDAGYGYACTCRQHRTNLPGEDPYQLARLEVNATDDRRRFDAKLQGRYALLYAAWYRVNPQTRSWIGGEG